jgi:hypothetical protein
VSAWPWPRAQLLRPPGGHEALPCDASGPRPNHVRAPAPCLPSRPTCIDWSLRRVRFLVARRVVVESELIGLRETCGSTTVGCGCQRVPRVSPEVSDRQRSALLLDWSMAWLILQHFESNVWIRFLLSNSSTTKQVHLNST